MFALSSKIGQTKPYLEPFWCSRSYVFLSHYSCIFCCGARYKKRIYEDPCLLRLGIVNTPSGTPMDRRTFTSLIWFPPRIKLVIFSAAWSIVAKTKFHKHLEKIVSEVEAEYAYKDEYVSDDIDSPANTCSDIFSVRHQQPHLPAALTGGSAQVGHIRDCVQAPKAYFENYKSDPDNILYGFHLFHNYKTPPRLRCSTMQLVRSICFDTTTRQLRELLRDAGVKATRSLPSANTSA